MPRLKRVDCSAPGIARRRRGRGFVYLYSDGTRVTDPQLLLHIKQLVIPPAWRDVWICADPNGHLQAVGTDAAGRKQYLYHPRWRERRDAQKFEHMLEFARELPELRGVLTEHLRGEGGLTHKRVLACAVRLLDRGFFRIGTEDYAEQNQTYGLATMHKRHVKLRDGHEIEFDYVSKSGKRLIRSVVDPEVYEIVAALKRRRGGGPELLAYRQGSRWMDVKSSDINLYIKDISGAEFTAKDFRTWNATVLAAVGIAVAGHAVTSQAGRKRAISLVVGDVARYLGNTPAIARASYIDPRVFDRFRSGWTILGAIEALGQDVDLGAPSIQGAMEEATLDLLEGNRDSPALERNPLQAEPALSA